MTTNPLAAHRLVLSAVEWASLVGVTGITAPPGFEPALFGETALQEALWSLTNRRVVVAGTDDYVPVPPVAVNLATLATSVVTIRVDVATREWGLRSFYAVTGSWGASLFTLPDGAVELSMFTAETLGRELVRAAPDAAGLAPEDARIPTALGRRRYEAPTGRLPLSAMAGLGDSTVVSSPETVTNQEAALAAQLNADSRGTLWCLVSGHGDDGVLVGQVVWLATRSGWIGLRPDPDGTGRRMVKVEPVGHADLGAWVAPYVAEILEMAGDKSPTA
jgi:hypothetical protein